MNTDKAVAMLQALLSGLEVRINGAAYQMKKGRLKLLMPYGDKKVSYPRHDMTLQKFLSLANQMDDTQLQILNKNMELNRSLNLK